MTIDGQGLKVRIHPPPPNFTAGGSRPSTSRHEVAQLSIWLGGASNDLLIGGTGSDTMIGAGGDDIMIAGFTSFDSNFAALTQIRDQWKSGSSYVERVAAVKLILPSSSVFDDGEQDLLTGSSGNDFFFANYVGHGVFDIITDLTNRDSLEEV